MPPWQVEQSLLERDLTMLRRYAEKWMLPTRRLQMQMARLCQIMASEGKRLGEYLFDPPDDSANDEIAHVAGETLADMGGGGRVFVLGRKKKQKAA